MEDKIKIFHLGGQDEKGKGLTVVEINDDIFVFNCGIKYPDRSKHGIDYTIPRFDYLIENKSRIRAYFITRGNSLAMGGLPYIIKRAPAKVICTSVTKELIEIFCEYVKAKVAFEFDVVNPCDERILAGRKFRFFQTATNTPRSFGIAVSTDKGNIVFIDDFVVDNNCEYGYETNTKMLAEVAREETLVLMTDSRYSVMKGYSNPKYKLVPLIEKTFRDAQGRIFIAINSLDIYNIEMVAKLAYSMGRVIIPYDEHSRDFYYRITKIYKERIPEKSFGTFDDATRLPPEKVLVMLTDHGNRIYNKIALFGNCDQPDKRMKPIPGDTFILGLHVDYKTDVLSTEAIDELYHNDDLNIIYFKKNQFIKMFASEEDLKTMLSILRPKYYAPISGDFKNLLANAKIAVDMKIGLTHMNCFILDNGMILEIDKTGAHISQNKVITGESLVDGYNIANNDLRIVNDRKTLAQDGCVVIGAKLSLKERKVTYGPDVQSRGIIVLKDTDAFNEEVVKVFDLVTQEEFSSPEPSISNLENRLIEEVLKIIRRKSLKTPLIVPSIIVE